MTLSAASQESRLRQMQPLILFGMHRSGTSLTVRLLAAAGIHMGSWLSRDAESVHFQVLNRRIFSTAGARWGEVEPLLQAMRSQEFVNRQTEAVRRAMFQDSHSPGRKASIVRFFGRTLWLKVERDETFAWGWKDPRTTLTFPIWLRIFPHARYVHVIRNGIDVAISTNRRSQKQQRKLRNRLFPIDYSPHTTDFGYCFRLWETYVFFALEHKHLIPPDQYLEMRYEDLLSEPQAQLRRLLDFVGHPAEDDLVRAACGQIDRSRLDNSRYAADYRDTIPTLLASPLMQQLGYGYSLAT